MDYKEARNLVIEIIGNDYLNIQTQYESKYIQALELMMETADKFHQIKSIFE